MPSGILFFISPNLGRSSRRSGISAAGPHWPALDLGSAPASNPWKKIHAQRFFFAILWGGGFSIVPVTLSKN